jgi:predicted dehydrogenase
MTAPRVALIGASGYGRVHLEHLIELNARRELALVAAVVIDRHSQTDSCARLTAIGCKIFSSWADLLKALPSLQLDLVVIPTPIHLHADMARELLAAGIHVLIEKPLAATTGEADIVSAAAAQAGRIAAVGFQYLHAPEVQELKRRLVQGDIGRVRRIAVHVAWPRSHAYYSRNNWAGRLRVADRWVLDSPVANAMAHFFVLLFYFAGETIDGLARATRIDAELYRAQAIESFDTAAIAIETSTGTRLEFYGTHSSRSIVRPTLVIEGERGTAEWIQDREARLVSPHGSWHHAAMPEPSTRERMLHDVLARLRGQPRFVCTPELAAEHVRCVNALQEYGRIVDLPRASLAQHREDGATFTYVPGLDAVLTRAFHDHSSLHAAGATWSGQPVSIDVRHYRGIESTG